MQVGKEEEVSATSQFALPGLVSLYATRMGKVKNIYSTIERILLFGLRNSKLKASGDLLIQEERNFPSCISRCLQEVRTAHTSEYRM